MIWFVLCSTCLKFTMILDISAGFATNLSNSGIHSFFKHFLYNFLSTNLKKETIAKIESLHAHQGFQCKWILLSRNCRPCKFRAFPSNGITIRNPTAHPGLTRVRCSQFLLFEFNRVLVYYTSTILKLTQLYYLYFFIQNEVPEKISFKLLGLGLNETELN